MLRLPKEVGILQVIGQFLLRACWVGVEKQQQLQKKGRMSSFLDRFVGRTQTVSKLGPEQLFKGKEEALIYTHTHKSFARSSTQQLRPPKPPLPRQSQESLPDQPPAKEEEQPFHLPHLEQRYLNSEFRRMHEEQTRSRLRLDKETNWLVEEPLPSEEPIEPPQQIDRTVASVDPQKQNHGRAPREKDERRLKSHHLQKSVSKLGGLGPNIGGEQWIARKEKQQKAKRYAQEVKRVRRQRVGGRQVGETTTSFNRVLINY